MKKILVLAVCTVMALSLAACKFTFKTGPGEAETSKSYTFNVETGDKIEVSMDTSGGYKLNQSDGSFTISKDDTKLMDGIFSKWTIAETIENYAQHGEIVRQSGTEVVWTADGEYNRALQITDKTGVIFASKLSAEEAEELYKRITFNVVEGNAVSQESTTEATSEASATEEATTASEGNITPDKIGDVSFSVPDGYKLSDGSIDTSRSYFNDNIDALHASVEPSENLKFYKEMYSGGKDVTYSGFNGYEYDREGSRGFVFEKGGKTYSFEADKADAFENVVNSLR